MQIHTIGKVDKAPEKKEEKKKIVINVIFTSNQ